jgi:hypothetical protein
MYFPTVLSSGGGNSGSFALTGTEISEIIRAEKTNERIFLIFFG